MIFEKERKLKSMKKVGEEQEKGIFLDINIFA